MSSSVKAGRNVPSVPPVERSAVAGAFRLGEVVPRESRGVAYRRADSSPLIPLVRQARTGGEGVIRAAAMFEGMKNQAQQVPRVFGDSHVDGHLRVVDHHRVRPGSRWRPEFFASASILLVRCFGFG